MSDTTRTMTFAAGAGVSVLLAVITYFATQPTESDGFENVGKVFYENFESSSQARELEVYAMDEDSAELKQFRVEENDGLWTIPSHYGYPAEASDRLANTSSSLIGLTRETLVGRFESDHERFGVLDPLDEENTNPEGTGKRVALKDRTGEELVDLIIGKQAEQQNASAEDLAFGQEAETVDYYVRRPDENQTYKVSMNLDLSTRFSDWIKPDLLDLEDAELTSMVIDNYELEEQKDPLGRVMRLFKKQGDQMKFDRDGGFGPWTMKELDTDTQQLDSTKLNTAVRTLDNLRIVGVRKKMDYKGQQLLNADLTLNQIEELKQDPVAANQILRQMQSELAENGFNLAPVANDPNQLTIVSSAGEMSAGTADGVVYTMHFGNGVEGDENEIEIGSPKSGSESSQENKDDDSGSTDVADSDTENLAKGDDATEKSVENRFLMIRVSFDETLLGDKPVKPIPPSAPVKPEGYVAEAEAVTKANDADAAPTPDSYKETSDAESSDADQESGKESEAEEPTDDRPEAFKQYEQLLQIYNQNKAQHQIQLTEFETADKEYAQKIEDGQKRVGELNERFGKWFYVISAANLESIQLSKDDLVSDKPKVENEVAEPPAGLPAGLPPRPNIKLDNEMPVDAPTETSQEDTKESAQPATPEQAGGDKPNEAPGNQSGESENAGSGSQPESSSPTAEEKSQAIEDPTEKSGGG